MKDRISLWMIALLVSLGMAHSSVAGTILNWDGQTAITADEDLAMGAGTVQGLIRNYTPGTAILDSSMAGYNGQNVYSITQVENTGGTATTTLDPSAGDRTDVHASRSSIWMGVDGDSPSADSAVRSIASLIWMDLDTAAAPGDYLSNMTLGLSDGGGLSDAALRFAVLSGGSWYVSEDSIDQAIYDTDVFSLSLTGSGTWAALSVADSSSTSMMTAGSTFGIAGNTLTEITAVGVFFEGASDSATSRSRIKLGDLTATVIPEPATLGLVAIFGGGVLLVRRRFMM